MKINKLASVKNPELKTIRDNKALWNLPKTRRLGYRNLHKINRYSLYLRSDLVLRLKSKPNNKISKIPLVKKMIKNKSFCSLIVGKGQDILFEKYAKDFLVGLEMCTASGARQIWGEGRITSESKPVNFLSDAEQGVYMWPHVFLSLIHI